MRGKRRKREKDQEMWKEKRFGFDTLGEGMKRDARIEEERRWKSCMWG